MALLLSLGAAPAGAGCRLALALALDVSASVDQAEFGLQMRGMAAALQAPAVQSIILADTVTPVVVSVFVWSGPGDEAVVTDWTELRDQETLNRVAAQIAGFARRSSFDGRTSIGSALVYGAFLHSLAPDCDRHVIDVAADGLNNAGPSPRGIRDDGTLGAITVNGLAIGAANSADLEVRSPDVLAAYLRSEVIRGSGAFVEVAQDHEDFEQAMTRKLVREIDVIMLGSR